MILSITKAMPNTLIGVTLSWYIMTPRMFVNTVEESPKIYTTDIGINFIAVYDALLPMNFTADTTIIGTNTNTGIAIKSLTLPVTSINTERRIISGIHDITIQYETPIFGLCLNTYLVIVSATDPVKAESSISGAHVFI